MNCQKSKLQLLKELPGKKRHAFLSALSPSDALALKYDISFTGRPKQQLPDGDWDTWLVLAGRGFGKSYCGSHTVIRWAREHPGCRIALIGETAADVRDVMVRGPSGIISQSHPQFMPTFNPSNRTLTFPNGSICQTFSGTEPNQLRGPNFHFAWSDELAKYRYQDEIWDMLTMCLRLGNHPQVLVTTTPRPTALMKKLTKDDSTHLTTGTSFENVNLPKKTLEKWKKQYEGTRLGQQELYAVMLDDNPNALFYLDNFSVNRTDSPPEMVRIVVAIDPAATNNEHSDETGIVVCGIDANDHGYILEDGSLHGSPNEWAHEAIRLYHKWQANYIIYESNMGGDMVATILSNINRTILVKGVRATRGKALRAEPVSALYEQNRIHHCGYFTKLEDQMANFDATITNKKSPDRLDACVYAISALMIKSGNVSTGQQKFGH